MIFYRALHFILRHFTALDNRILDKMRAVEKTVQGVKVEDFSSSLPEKDRFFSGISVITHAGGGLQGMNYLNSKDAFSFYYDNGNRVFEYDVDISSDDRFICTHSDEPVAEQEHLKRKIDHRFSPISIEECLELIRSYKDIKVIFDCKFRDLQPFAEYIKDVLPSKDDLSRVVIQVFSEENIAQVRNVWNFHMLFVCMNNTDFMEAAELCVKHHIAAVSISTNSVADRAGWTVFKKANICTFIYTVNTAREFMELKKAGLDGVFSDFLFEKDVQNI